MLIYMTFSVSRGRFLSAKLGFFAADRGNAMGWAGLNPHAGRHISG
jgi:hypothetical protein